MNVELAVMENGQWEFIAEFSNVEDAIAAAKELADEYRDDRAAAVFGISNDPDSGHYEITITVWEDGTAVEEVDGVVTGKTY